MDIGRMFLVGNEIIMQCEFPSREGRLGCCFLLGNEIIIKGCVMVRGGGWDEEFLLLFG